MAIEDYFGYRRPQKIWKK